MAASKHRFTIQDRILILDSEARVDARPLIENDELTGPRCKVLGVDTINVGPHRLVLVVNPLHSLNKVMRGIEYELDYRPVIDKSTQIFQSSYRIEVTTSKSLSNFKTEYENSLTDERIAELHAGKPIRICNDAYYAAIREKPNTVKTKEQIDEEYLVKIKEYVDAHPNSTSEQISEATKIPRYRVTQVCSNNTDTFVCMRGYRTVLYRVK